VLATPVQAPRVTLHQTYSTPPTTMLQLQENSLTQSLDNLKQLTHS